MLCAVKKVWKTLTYTQLLHLIRVWLLNSITFKKLEMVDFQIQVILLPNALYIDQIQLNQFPDNFITINFQSSASPTRNSIVLLWFVMIKLK